MFNSKALIAAGALAMGLAAQSASAAVIDFTDRDVFDGAPFETVVLGGVTVSVSSLTGGLNFDEDFDGPVGSTGGLAEESDGLGISNDEVSAGQFALIEFSEAVFVRSISFLDLFFGPIDANNVEIADVEFSDGTTLSFAAAEQFTPGGAGFQTTALLPSVRTTSLLFSIDALNNDEQGEADFSVAAIQVSAVPIPAAGVMLLSALAGVGFLARRRRAVA